jgi:hydrogenase-4 component B
VSALMSGVIHKAGLFGLLRFTLLMGEPEPWMGWYIISFSSLSALMGVLYTTSQRDLKRLLGYSSTENVGIAGIGFGIGYLGLCWHQPMLVALGFTGGILHILNHALFKCLLFYAAGSVYRAAHSIDLERLGGLLRKMPWTATLFLVGALAISGLPPLNGFVSELIIYSGLLHESVPSGIQQTLLICAAALLAFVGGISALAMTRAFGLAFLGSPRDSNLHVQGDATLSMRITMVVHALGAVLVGLFPGFALRLVDHPVRLFSAISATGTPGSMVATTELLGAVANVAWLFLAVLAALMALRWVLARPRLSARHVTWACGYTAASPRMQYTGTSFSAQFASLFEGILLHVRREKLPEGPFPQHGSHLNSHCVDVVERRLFEALGEGEGIATRVVARISEEPRFAFGLGLLVLGILAGGLVLGGLR